ncbi:Detected protein of confused Function [Hibiscus syriacus]|uniref:Detected protein of confused Function n=1 Tax=Hibiscus syriacus TaxID=106335 RepID=A0A6A2XIB0_HIBSY|nr:Detected protein of confused Function [Hibiscus syriacus]
MYTGVDDGYCDGSGVVAEDEPEPFTIRLLVGDNDDVTVDAFVGTDECSHIVLPRKLGTVHLCRSVIRSIETARIFYFEEFPRRDKVTYMYYTGRLEVLNENFPAADHKLSYALTHCSPLREANIRIILKFLIPVKLSLGILPKPSLLEKYNLLEYNNVVQALKRGDLRLLRHALQEHEDHYFIQKQKDPSKAHQLKLEVIVKALKWIEMDMDLDEVECIMTILIYKNLVKGTLLTRAK